MKLLYSKGLRCIYNREIIGEDEEFYLIRTGDTSTERYLKRLVDSGLCGRYFSSEDEVINAIFNDMVEKYGKEVLTYGKDLIINNLKDL